MKTYMITGVTGYIGHTLLDKLSKQDDTKVYAVVRPSSTPTIIRDNIDYITYDGTQASLETAVKNSEALIHLGALYTTGTDEASVNNLIASNITFSTLLFNVASEVNPDITIASASTFSALDENGNYKPTSLYAATKKAVEDIAQYYSNLSIHFLTLPDTYGPDDWRPKIHNILARNKNWPFEFRSQAQQIIRMLHVEDVIGHFLSSLDNNEKGVHIHDIYSTGTFLSLLDLSKAVTDGKCTFPEDANLIKIPWDAREESTETGYKNKHTKVSFPWFK